MVKMSKSSEEYPEHLNPFTKSKRRLSFSRSYKELKGAIRQSFRKNKRDEDRHYPIEYRKKDWQSNVSSRESCMSSISPVYADTTLFPPLPRSRFKERLSLQPSSSNNIEPASRQTLQPNASRPNPFDEDERKHENQNIQPKPKKLVRRRSKKRAPLPPGFTYDKIIDDSCNVSRSSSNWSLTSTETNIRDADYTTDNSFLNSTVALRESIQRFVQDKTIEEVKEDETNGLSSTIENSPTNNAFKNLKQFENTKDITIFNIVNAYINLNNRRYISLPNINQLYLIQSKKSESKSKSLNQLPLILTNTFEIDKIGQPEIQDINHPLEEILEKIILKNTNCNSENKSKLEELEKDLHFVDSDDLEILKEEEEEEIDNTKEVDNVKVSDGATDDQNNSHEEESRESLDVKEEIDFTTTTTKKLENNNIHEQIKELNEIVYESKEETRKSSIEKNACNIMNKNESEYNSKYVSPNNSENCNSGVNEPKCIQEFAHETSNNNYIQKVKKTIFNYDDTRNFDETEMPTPKQRKYKISKNIMMGK